MSELVLHQHNESPYGEKIRTRLGCKQLAWRSVSVPRIAPEPELASLTGGFRKVPALQVGAAPAPTLHHAIDFGISP